MPPAEFDAYAADYDAQHAASIRLSGEEPDYFARYKAEDAARALAAAGLEPARILDFGAGIGNAVPHLQRAFPSSRLTALDVSDASLQQAQARALRPIDIASYDGSTLPFADGSFDFAFTACVFHHIDEEDHVRLLGEIRRVLSARGRFMLFEHNPYNPLTRHAVANCPFDEHAVLITAPEMRRRLLKAGFTQVQRTYRIFFPAPLAALRPLERALGWLPLGAQYSLLAR